MACIILVCRTSLDIHVLAEAGVNTILVCRTSLDIHVLAEARADHSMSGPIFQCSPLGVNDF